MKDRLPGGDEIVGLRFIAYVCRCYLSVLSSGVDA